MAGSWKNSMGKFADRTGSAATKAFGAVANCAPIALKGGAGGAVVGALGAGGVAATEGMALNAIGFTALGPTAGSYAAGWMSSIAVANGVGVSAGSWYATLQAAAMGGGALLGAPFVIGACATCAVAGVVAMTVVHSKGGDGGGDAAGGDDPAPGDSTEPELSSEEEDKTEPEESDELPGQ